MSSRREFIFQGLAVAAATQLVTQPTLAAAGGAASAGASPVGRVIVDTRFDDSLAFGRMLTQAGHVLAPIQGDVTHLWLEQLEPALRSSPHAIAGLTTERSFLCLEMLASGYGLRTVFHVEHLYPGDGHVEHSLRAPPELLARAAPLSQGATRWPEHVAGLVAGYRAGRRPAPGRALHAARVAQSAQPDVEALVSWVLAPLPRA